MDSLYVQLRRAGQAVEGAMQPQRGGQRSRGGGRSTKQLKLRQQVKHRQSSLLAKGEDEMPRETAMVDMLGGLDV